MKIRGSNLSNVPQSLLFFVSIAIGILTSFFVNVLAYLISDIAIDVREEMGILLLHAVIATFPFGLLSVVDSRSKWAWTTALLLTLFLWGWVLIDAIVRKGDGSGANIGLGLIILTSPIWISLPSLAIARNSENSGDNGNSGGNSEDRTPVSDD